MGCILSEGASLGLLEGSTEREGTNDIDGIEVGSRDGLVDGEAESLSEGTIETDGSTDNDGAGDFEGDGVTLFLPPMSTTTIVTTMIIIKHAMTVANNR